MEGSIDSSNDETLYENALFTTMLSDVPVETNTCPVEVAPRLFNRAIKRQKLVSRRNADSCSQALVGGVEFGYSFIVFFF